MALARIARSGLRRSRGAIGSYLCHKDSFFDGVSTQESSSPFLVNAKASDDLSYLSSHRKVNHMSFWLRGIRMAPHYRFPSAKRDFEESESEYEDHKYPRLEATKKGEKPRVVVLGSGWAACRFLKGLDTKVYDVVCISQRSYMEFPSVSEPVSQIQTALSKDRNSYFYFANCIGVDTSKHEIHCETAGNDELPHEPYRFKVAYDKLVIASRAEPLTFGIEGVKENAFFLCEVNHAQEIRKKLLLNLMLSENPAVSKDEKKRLLHCVVIGGGPTGVKFSSELSDFIMKDVHERYTHVKDYIKVTLIEANEMLTSFDTSLKEYATHHLTKPGVRLMKGVVKEVHPKTIVLKDGTEVSYGLLVWSTGVGPSDFVKKMNVPKSSGGRIGVDGWLRVPSVEDVFALGDCAGFLEHTGRPVVPALAQVAEREGKYLVELFNKIGDQNGGKAYSAKYIPLGDPFLYKNSGSMASVDRYKALRMIKVCPMPGVSAGSLGSRFT